MSSGVTEAPRKAPVFNDLPTAWAGPSLLPVPGRVDRQALLRTDGSDGVPLGRDGAAITNPVGAVFSGASKRGGAGPGGLS